MRTSASETGCQKQDAPGVNDIGRDSLTLDTTEPARSLRLIGWVSPKMHWAID